ncbi:putative molybdenum carrier protein [Corynebacterium glyciniphilum]|uniref:putative molybdenum carrier protein n=1 Tax=Corynebacterium glyciniphilum TaxID=1404244 RepID=UPI002651BECF|nr:putative molybdenum carrier protein [Corynebacterium glyciniphilum]MDN5683276.1 putative molybdenum carrier protein [Corynebacterium glyciniphilum]MDN6706652.1 putative molybdenum carrier protein [Corynebacterium glyciniphilum]
MIATIRSGGQSGVDRGALDAARAADIPVVGWCPAGGWAEDHPTPPGLLTVYPELAETPSPETKQRTEWNVRDSDATLILTAPEGTSPGTDLTVGFASHWQRPHLVLDASAWDRSDMTAVVHDVSEWLRQQRQQGSGLVVNVAGPRASEWAGAYAASYRLVTGILEVGAR